MPRSVNSSTSSAWAIAPLMMWALGTRLRWHEGVVTIPGAHGNELDPSADAHGITAKVILDATLPAEARKRYIKVAYPAVELEKYLKGG